MKQKHISGWQFRCVRNEWVVPLWHARKQWEPAALHHAGVKPLSLKPFSYGQKVLESKVKGMLGRLKFAGFPFCSECTEPQKSNSSC
jgi:hypothetical protein